MQVIGIQLETVWENKAANHQRVTELLSAKACEPGSLIVLPEMFDTGFSSDLAVTAQTNARESESFLKTLARQTECAVLAGVVGENVNGQASNLAVAFAPDGTELVRYRKMQPFTPAEEDVHYGAGNEHRIFEWDGVRIAPFVCYDLRFPEVFRPAAKDGAELIVLMACWPCARSEHWVRLLQARAIENQAYVIGVNQCGADPSFRYDGRSTAFDPHGNQLFEADAAEQTFTVPVDAKVVQDWRSAFPALRDMR